MRSTIVPVLEIGGTHVTAAIVRLTLIGDQHAAAAITVSARGRIPADGTAVTIAEAIADGVQRVDPARDHSGWSVAIPGPFDYRRGIGLFRGVGKFASLNGVDVGELLRRHVGITAIRFINDADAFGLGEYAAGAGSAYDPGVYLTLGTGVGSAFIRSGRCVHEGPEVPPDGHAYRIMIDGVPLEDRMSRRAIIAAWLGRTGEHADVADLAARAAGDQRIDAVFADAYDALARGMIDHLRAFDARAMIIGGSIAGSWWLIERHLVTAMRRLGCDIPVLPADRPDEAPLVGAAWAAYQQTS